MNMIMSFTTVAKIFGAGVFVGAGIGLFFAWVVVAGG